MASRDLTTLFNYSRSLQRGAFQPHNVIPKGYSLRSSVKDAGIPGHGEASRGIGEVNFQAPLGRILRQKESQLNDLDSLKALTNSLG